MASVYTTLQTEADVLSSFAFADARHDFDRDRAGAFLTVLQESLPGHISWIPDEDSALDIATRLSGNALTPVSTDDANALFRTLGGSPDTPIAILCDSSFCVHLMYLLANNTIGKVYFIQNREVENDPGDNLKTSHIRVPFDVLRDVHATDVYYPAYDSRNPTITTKLCSVFDVYMNLEDVIFLFEDELVNIMNYYDGTTELPQLIDKIGTHNYSNTELYQDPTTLHEIQCAFLEKRAGDWLQTLSCVDRDREYEGSDGQRRNLKNMVTYFCSSDRIPLAYALYLGISCIRKRISRVTKDVSYSYYKNPTDRIAVSHTQSMYEHFLSQYPSYTTGEKYAETKANLLLGIELYERHSRALLAEMQRVTESTTVEDLRVRLGYALHYTFLREIYKPMQLHIESVHMFLENPLDDRITDDHKCKIANVIARLGCAIKSFRDFDIHTPIYDEKFRVFDPTTYFVEFHELRYSIVYGQVILSTLFNKKCPELEIFVRQFVDALIPLVDSDIVTTHYSLFLERCLGVRGQGGGGTLRPYDPAHLKFIGEYWLEYLTATSNVAWTGYVQTRKGSQRHSFGPLRVFPQQLRAIVLDYGIHIDGLQAYIETSPYAVRLSDIADFLKIQRPRKKRNTFRRNQKRQRARRMTRRRHCRHTRRPALHS